jgi:uncharacterized glyoxalase superfamily protein PhnB
MPPRPSSFCVLPLGSSGKPSTRMTLIRPDVVQDRYHWKTPSEAGGVTMCVCAVIEDPDAHAARARVAGAEIITEPHDNEGYPGRSYDARDPEGNVWNFGNYDPFA